jgi:hypothetical protein
MPKIKTIKEYSRNHKTFPIGTEINVTWEGAYQLEKDGICIVSPKVEKVEKIEVKTKKVKKAEKDGSTK